MKKFKELKLMTEEKKDKYDEGEYDQEGDMAKSDLRSIMANAKELHDMIDDADNLPEWCQNKITLAEDYISTVANYLTAEMSEEVKTVTVKHKTSGKELVVSPEKAKQLKPQGYHPVKEEIEQIGEEDAYSKDRYAVKNGKAVKDNPTHKGSSNYKDQPHHVYATSAEEALKKHMKKEEVEQIEEGIEVKKEYNDKTEAEHGVYHNGKKIGYVVHHKPSGTHTAYHSPQDDDDYGQIDDFRSHHDAVSQIRHSAGVGVHEEVEQIDEKNEPTNPSLWSRAKALARSKFDVYPSAYANGWASKWYKSKGGSWRSVSEEVEQIEEAIEVKKEYNDKTEAEHGVYHKGKKIGYVVHHKPSGTHTAYHSPQDDDDYGQIDDFRSHHDAVSQIRHSAGVGVHEEVEQIDEKNVPTSPEKWAQAKSQAKAKFDVYPSAYANGWAAKKYKARGGSWKSVSEATDPPFDKPYTTIKKVVTDKSGAKHSPMSRARDIARMAMKKQMEKMKPVKESLEESRKAEIVKEIMKKKKDKSEDAFQKDPELTTTLTKGI